jgi:carbamoyl-phosphate synthase large subunit
MGIYMKHTLKNKKVFVSGGAGVIGNELIPLLYEAGADIFVGDLKPRPKQWPEQICYRQGDLNFIAKEELYYFKPEIFIHLAATFERSTETYDFWYENFNHNVRLSNYLMTLLKDLPSLSRVVFASSYLIYDQKLYSFPTPQKKAISLSEENNINPRNLTGTAKLQHEIELNFLAKFKSQQFTSVSARIFRGYGKGSRCVISRWIKALLDGKAIQVYKKEGLFDYIYAKDTALGLMKLAQAENVTGIINLGTGKSRKVADIVSILQQHFPEMVSEEMEADIDYEASEANIEKLIKEIKWKPAYTLEEAIREIIEYEKDHKQVDEKKMNVLITSISKKVPLINSVKNAASKLAPGVQLFGSDSNPKIIGKYFVDAFWQMPLIKDITAACVIDFCKKNNIKAIIPTRDGELPFFASIKNELLSHRITVMVSEAKSVDVCMDKLKFYIHCQNISVNTIQTETKIELIQSKEYVVKEQFGAGSLSIGLKLDKEQAMVHSKNLNAPIFQPFIEGEEFSIDMYIQKNGTIKGIVIRKRELVENGESQVTYNIKNEKLKASCISFASSLQFYGHIVLQAIVDEKGNPYLIECNARFGGASTFSIKCGLDSFYWCLLEASGQDITAYPFIYNEEANYKQIRYAEDKFVVPDGVGV